MLMRALDSLARRVELERKEWRTTNEVRKDLAYSLVQGVILHAAEDPARNVPNCFLFAVTLTALVWWFGLQIEVSPADAYKSADVISYLAALWSVQAAIAALVYPIVIGFIALLFQGRYNAKAVLYVYLHDTAALLAGLSSLALIALIGIHHLATHQASPSVVLAWVAMDSVWFLINMVLTAFFLARTFEFLLPDKRSLIIQRYAVNVAWPNELRVHLSEAFFASAVLSKWLPGTAFGEKDNETEPKVLLGSPGLGMGQAAISIYVGRHVHLVDVWLRPLSWATASWLKRARAVQARLKVPSKHEAPVLVFPLTPESEYNHRTDLCRVVGDVALSPIEQWLVRVSFRFSRRRRRPFDISVAAVFADMEADARQAIAADNVVAFEEKLDELRTLYRLLVQASICKDTKGQDENYTRIFDAAHWFGSPAFKSWSRVFLSLFDVSITALDRTKAYVPKLAYTPGYLFSKLLDRGHEDILVHTIRLFPMFQRKIAVWWQRTLEQQGVSEHGPCAKQLLKPPHQGGYESVLVELVGAWSSLKNHHFPLHRNETPTWDELRKGAAYFQAHLSGTLHMLLSSVLRGDQASAEWWSDVLLKWWDQIEYRFDRGALSLRSVGLLNIELTKKAWDEITTQVDIQTFGVPARAPKAVFAVCFRNLWVDSCCVAMYVLAMWGRDCDCERSLAAHVLHKLLNGQAFREGGTTVGNLRPISGPGDLLVAYMRQNYAAGGFRAGYRATLDQWVDEIAGLKEMEWVPGWMYSGWGSNDLHSLRPGQLTVLSLLITPDWNAVRGVDAVLRTWVHEDEEKLRDLSRDMEQWSVQLGAMSNYKGVFDCYKKGVDPQPEFGNALNLITGAVESISNRVNEIRGEALRDAPVSSERLREVENWASEKAFAKTTAEFPVSLFAEVHAVDGEGDVRSLVIKRMDKGLYTEPPMGQRPVNEQEWFAETMSHQVAGFVMAQILQDLVAEIADGGTAEQYWAQVKRYRDRTVAANHQPILLVENPTIPSWVWDWSLTEWDKDREPPYGLTVTHDAQFDGEDGYLGNFGDVAVFNAPMPPGASYLIAMQALEKLEFTRHGEVFVSATARPIEDDQRLIDVVLSWKFKLRLRELPSVKLTYSRKASE